MTPPMERARSLVLYLKAEGWTPPHRERDQPPDPVDHWELAQCRFAEIIAEALDDLRDGFLKKPRGRDPTTHE